MVNDRRFADTGVEPPDQDLKTRVAWLYHMEDMTQEAIAERLGLTRIRVVKLLAQCRRDGTVQIRVTGKLSECAALERDLESKFSIGEAIVIPTPDDASKISSAQVLNVKFEELLMSPEKIIGDVSKHCGITFEEGMLDVPIIGSSSGKDSISRGIDSSRSQSWKTGGLNSAELWFCERICKSNMTVNDYTLNSSTPNYILIAFYFLLFPVKIFLALLFNLHRMNNIIDTIKRRLK